MCYIICKLTCLWRRTCIDKSTPKNRVKVRVSHFIYMSQSNFCDALLHRVLRRLLKNNRFYVVFTTNLIVCPLSACLAQSTFLFFFWFSLCIMPVWPHRSDCDFLIYIFFLTLSHICATSRSDVTDCITVYIEIYIISLMA